MQTVDKDRLQLVDVVSCLYGDAEPTRRAGKPAAVVCRLVAALTQIFVAGLPTAAHRALHRLAGVQVVVLWGEAVVVQGLVRPVIGVEVVFGPRAVTRAVTRAVGRAVGHQAGLQAAISAHGPVEVQSSDQRLSDVDAFGPVDGVIVIHGCKAALKAHGEDQLLLQHN